MNERDGPSALLRTGIPVRCPGCRKGAITFDGQVARCDHCDWTRKSDIPDFTDNASFEENRQRAIYDETLTGFTQTSDPLRVFVTPSGHQKVRMLKRLPLGEGQRFLEIGGGAGPLADGIASNTGATGFSIDISPQSVRAQLQRRGSRGHYDVAVGTATNLPFPDATFDVVVSFDVMEHLEEPELLAAEAFRVLKPGGTWVVRSPVLDFGWTIDWLQYHMRREPWMKAQHTLGHFYENFRTKRQYRRMAETAGFQHLRSQGFDIFWDNLIEYYLLRPSHVIKDSSKGPPADGIKLRFPTSFKHRTARFLNRLLWLGLIPERLLGKLGFGASFWMWVRKP